MNRRWPFWFILVVGFILLRALFGSFYCVNQTEQVIITQFGKPVTKSRYK